MVYTACHLVLAFQSACEARIQTIKSHSKFDLAVCSHAYKYIMHMLYCYPGFPTLPRVYDRLTASKQQYGPANKATRRLYTPLSYPPFSLTSLQSSPLPRLFHPLSLESTHLVMEVWGGNDTPPQEVEGICSHCLVHQILIVLQLHHTCRGSHDTSHDITWDVQAHTAVI